VERTDDHRLGGAQFMAAGTPGSRRAQTGDPAGTVPAHPRGRGTRVATQAALRESEARYRILSDRSIQGICIHRDFVILFANPALATMFGFESPAELIGIDLRGALAPDERARLEAHRVAGRHGRRAPIRYECHAIRKDGTRIWVEIMAAPVSWAGKP